MPKTQYRILFVDDEKSILTSLGNYFRELGYEVHTAASGKEGIGVHSQIEPHVTVLDLAMPGMSGMEVLEVLRKRRAVIIMLTGHGEIESAVQAMRLGAENFLQKPIDMPHLVAAVEKAAEKADLRRENLELRERLVPSLRRRLMRVGIFAVLVGAALYLGSLIGGTETARPTVPIPVPIEGDTLLRPTPGPQFGGGRDSLP